MADKLSKVEKRTQKLEELKKHRVDLVTRLQELKAERNEMASEYEAKRSGMSTADKYRQFGSELINSDPTMAAKYYDMADDLDNKDKGTEGKVPQDAKLLIDLINSKSKAQYNSNMFASASEAKKESLGKQLRAEIEPLKAELAKMYNGKYLPYISDVAGGQAPTKVEPPPSGEGGSSGVVTLDNATSYSTASQALNDLALPQYKGTKEAKAWLADVRSRVNANSGIPNKDKSTVVADAEAKLALQPSHPDAGKKGETEKFIKEYMANVDSKKVVKALGEWNSGMSDMVNLFNSGKNAPIILKGFKSVMGNMTGEEYGVASGDATAAALGDLGGLFSAISSALNTKTFNDMDDAATVVNDMIRGVKSFMSGVNTQGLLPPKYKGDEYATKLFSESAPMQSILNALSKVKVPSPVSAKGKKKPGTKVHQEFAPKEGMSATELRLLNDYYNEYTKNNKKLPKQKMKAMIILAKKYRGL